MQQVRSLHPLSPSHRRTFLWPQYELMEKQWYNRGEWHGGLSHLLTEFTRTLWPCSFPIPDMPRVFYKRRAGPDILDQYE